MEDDGRGRPRRRLDSSSGERTGAGIKNLGDLSQRQGPLAPGSTRVSRPRFRRSVAKPVELIMVLVQTLIHYQGVP
ncbi:hypothetical protein NDU88_001897 [Pleurodeles waltl]|uniref:Uncharacterized protein n=1 Tax=Pleurodeles waltl TaxID=8319 RepID=A0AAV7T185_PLEWA|nr:hypothetical protein NDU88_001897 [Pleurodeles waltl]